MSAPWAAVGQIALLVLALVLTVPPMARLLTHVYTSDRHWRVERLTYRMLRLDPEADQTWRTYAISVLGFSVVGVLIHGRIRSDVAALAAAAALLLLGVIRPVEVQGAFASPAVIALASLFVIAYAIELSGLLGLMIRQATKLCARLVRSSPDESARLRPPVPLPT